MTANSSLDLLVIGAGWSGLMAAHTASRAGLSVKVIAKGLGSMHWATGCIDLFGYAPDAPEAAIKRPLDYVANKLAKEQPQHPYALLGKDRLVEALDSFIALANELGLPYGGAAQPGENLLLPTAVGAARPRCLVPDGAASIPQPCCPFGAGGAASARRSTHNGGAPRHHTIRQTRKPP